LKRLKLYDYLWYIIGTLIPILIKLIQSPIFTREFTPAEYGLYSLVLITYTYLTLGLFSWLSDCLWRYYLSYKNKGEIVNLMTNIVFLFTISSFILFVIAFVWLKLTLDTRMQKLIIYGLFLFLSEQLLAFYLIIIRLENKARKFGVFKTIQIGISFAFLCIMVFGFNFRIEALFISNLLINLILLIYIIYEVNSYLRFRINILSKAVIKELLSFGFAIFIANFCMVVLINSDRYIIALYTDISKVGIYNQLYNLSQISIMAGITIFFNIITPHLFNILENRPIIYNKMVNRYILVFNLILLPVSIYISLFSKEISTIMLGEPFRECYSILPLILFSNYIYGLINFTELKFKFESRLKALIYTYASVAALNILLNVLLIPHHGYKIAGLTTLICYLALWLVMYRQHKNNYLKYLFSNNDFKIAILILVVQTSIYIIIHKIASIKTSLGFAIAEAFVFAVIYLMINYRRIWRLI
jgi:O-antigen/teichoic acid export membrane protein